MRNVACSQLYELLYEQFLWIVFCLGFWFCVCFCMYSLNYFKSVCLRVSFLCSYVFAVICFIRLSVPVQLSLQDNLVCVEWDFKQCTQSLIDYSLN